MIQLGMNIDHIATLREARQTYEPDPVWAAVEAQLGGADLITMHLREDRRHIQDHDVQRVMLSCQIPVNLEMAATSEMVRIARGLQPAMATLVPEGRQEVTTEGGLDVAGQRKRLKQVVARLKDAGVEASAFIDAQKNQVDAARECGFAMCEIHTGPFARAFDKAGGNALSPALSREWRQVFQAGLWIMEAGMRFNAGHALNYRNVGLIAGLPGVGELHIGHAIVSRAVFVGLRAAVGEMKAAMVQAAAAAEAGGAGMWRPGVARGA